MLLSIGFFFNETDRVAESMRTAAVTAAGSTVGIYRDSVSNLMTLVESISLDPMYGPEPDGLNTILFKLKRYKAVETAFFLDSDEKRLASADSLEENLLLGKTLSAEQKIEKLDQQKDFLDM